MAQNFEARNSCQPGAAYLWRFRPSFQLFRLHILSYNSPISRFCPSGDASYGEWAIDASIEMLRSKRTDRCFDRNEPIETNRSMLRSKRTDRCFDRNEPIDASIEMPRSKQMLRLKCSDRSMGTSLGFRVTRAFGSARIRQTTTTTTTTTGERHGGLARGGVGSPGEVHAERGREPRGGRGGGARTRRRGERARGRSTAATTRGLARARRG